MPEDTKNPNQPETPKDIEDLLKDLPKVNQPKPQTPNTSLPNVSADQTKPSTPQNPPPPLKPFTSPAPKPLSPPPLPVYSSPPTAPPKPLNQPIDPTKTEPTSDKFKTFIRTMNQDLEAAKKGQKSEPKPFEIKPPPSAPKIPAPLPPPKPLMPPSEIKLGPSERTRSLDIKTPKVPAPDVVKRKLPISPKFLIIILAGLAVVAGAWYFLNKSQEGTVISTPTLTPMPLPVMPPLSEIFESPYLIAIPESADFADSFKDSLKKVPLASFVQFKPIVIADENNNEYALNEIFTKLEIILPDGLLESLDPNDWLFAAYGQQEEFDERGLMSFLQTPKIKLGLIAKATDPDLLRSALNIWEASMASDLKNLLPIDPQKATSQILLDNIYNGNTIRYMNFPYSDNTIDYAIVNLSKFGADYFVLTNSRESIFSAIDLLENQ